jgi:phage FluMu protein Com
METKYSTFEQELQPYYCRHCGGELWNRESFSGSEGAVYDVRCPECLKVTQFKLTKRGIVRIEPRPSQRRSNAENKR